MNQLRLIITVQLLITSYPFSFVRGYDYCTHAKKGCIAFPDGAWHPCDRGG